VLSAPATRAAAAPHDGIVDPARVHGSSLASMHLSPPRAKPLIFLNATCPFAQKAWIALLEKEVDFEVGLALTPEGVRMVRAVLYLDHTRILAVIN
jgi:hypothetical protein